MIDESNKMEISFEIIQNPEEITFENSKDLIEKDLGETNIEDDDLLDEAIGDNIMKDYRKKYLGKMDKDGYKILLFGYFQSFFQKFENFFQNETSISARY